MSVLLVEFQSLWRRRHALMGIFGLGALAAWLLGLPFVLVVARSGIAAYPAADAQLFGTGGLMLVEVLRASAESLGAAYTRFELGGAAVVVVTPFVLCAWCASAPDEAYQSQSGWLTRALRAYPDALCISAGLWFARAILLLLGAFVAATVRARLDGIHDLAVDLFGLLVFVCACLAVAVTPPLRDIAVVHAMRHNAGMLRSLLASLSILSAEWRPLLARLSLLYGVLACVALLAVHAPNWAEPESSGFAGSVPLLVGGPMALAVCVMLRASLVDHARRAHRRWMENRSAPR